MCGIIGGFWRREPGDIESRLAAALGCLKHRGPNDQGYEIFRGSAGTVALGQTRLSVIDLSSGGHQPMLSDDGTLAIVFNGEIYNYSELREELRAAGRVFRSESDTEVLLTAWAEWGQACLPRLEGMFAFVVHDRRAGRLTCVRDAFGIKPFFYEQGDGGMIFASEQPALLSLRSTRARPDLQRGYDYLVHGQYDNKEHTFIEGVRQLLPGMLLEVEIASKRPAEPVTWWRPSISEASSLSFDDAADAVRERFLHNIRLHLRSDVPLGSALSGGIDSSAVVCAIRHIEPDMPIHTFSYIAESSDVSEESWVDLVNEKTGAIPHKVRANAMDLVQDLDALIVAQGEPFGSTSIYAQYRVFQLARENGVTVTLDGQGADELLAGYIGYPGQRMLSLLESGRYWALHGFARRWGVWPGRSYKLAWRHFRPFLVPGSFHNHVRKAIGRDFQPLWLKTGMLRDEGVVFRSSIQPPLTRAGRRRRVVEQLAYNLQVHGLPALLRHGDRNSMAHSIESRVPFLTIPMADLLLSLPEDHLISDVGETKSVFRRAMRGIVPDAILDRRDKIGFATPERDWLVSIAPVMRGWLKDATVPLLDRTALLEAFDGIIAGRAPFSWQLWRWVNYVRWYQLQGFDEKLSDVGPTSVSRFHKPACSENPTTNSDAAR